MGARKPSIALAVVLALVMVRSSGAEEVDETGTFEGVYHVDRWGRAAVGIYVIPEDLQQRFGGMEGKPVRFEVLEGAHRESDGPVFVKRLGAVAALTDEPQVAVSLTAYPMPLQAGDRATLMVTLRNAGARPIAWRPNMASGLGSYEIGSDVPDPLGQSERPPRTQMYYLGRTPSWWWNLNVLHRLAPGESLTYSLSSAPDLEAGRHELEVHVFVGTRAFAAWKPVDVAPIGAPRTGALAPPRATGIAATDVSAATHPDSRHRRESEGRATLGIDWTLRATVAPGPSLFWGTRRDGKSRTTRVAIRAYDESGREFPLSTWTQIVEDGRSGGMLENGDWNSDAWTLAPLPEGGLQLHAEVWPWTAFPPPQPWAFVAEVFTSEWIARTVVVRGEFPDLAVPPIPFGPEREHVRLRARTAVDPMPAAGRRAVFVEAQNTGAAPAMLLPPVPWEEHIFLEIDGKEERIEAGPDGVLGWAANHTVKEPEQGTVHLPEGVSLAPGKHVLRVVIRPPGGTYENTLGESIRVLEGEIWSAPVHFTVR